MSGFTSKSNQRDHGPRAYNKTSASGIGGGQGRATRTGGARVAYGINASGDGDDG